MFHTLCFELWGASMAKYLPKWESKMDPGLLELVKESGKCATFDFVNALEERVTLQHQAIEFFRRFDLLLTPTMALPPFDLEIDLPNHVAGRRVKGMEWTPFTFPFNLTGQPAITVPAGWTMEGLPVGLQIVGPWRNDQLVLRAAAAYEAAAGWSDRWPPLASAEAAAPLGT